MKHLMLFAIISVMLAVPSCVLNLAPSANRPTIATHISVAPSTALSAEGSTSTLSTSAVPSQEVPSIPTTDAENEPVDKSIPSEVSGPMEPLHQ